MKKIFLALIVTLIGLTSFAAQSSTEATFTKQSKTSVYTDAKDIAGKPEKIQQGIKDSFGDTIIIIILSDGTIIIIRIRTLDAQ